MKEGAVFLLINTAFSDKIFFALFKGDFLISQQEIKTDFRNSEKLLVGIDKLLKKTKIDLKKIKGIFVVKGPGSFTSLKIGLTLANVLGFSLKIPVIGLKISEVEKINNLGKLIIKKFKLLKNKRKIVLPIFAEKAYYEK